MTRDPIDFTNYNPIGRTYVTATIDLLIHERDEALRQLANANRINNELSESITRVTRENAKLKAQAPIELTTLRDDLNAAIEHINTVVTQQHHLLDGTGSLARVADIRRRQVAKGYTPEHDDHEGEVALVNAASALVMHRPGLWPWHPAHFEELYDDPDRLLHAAALLCAAQDVIDRKRKAKGNA